MKFTLAISMCDPSHYAPLAEAAERCGWDAVCVPDGGPWTEAISDGYLVEEGERWWQPDTPFLDPWVLIADMAARTRRLRFYTNVMKIPIRAPFLVAKAVASAAVLSGERVALGVGLGWNRDEFVALGEDFETRGPRTNEALEIIRALWGGGLVEYHGKYYDFAPLQLSPVPTRDVPIYVGGQSPGAYRRAARYGDGWCAQSPHSEEVLDAVPVMRRHLAEQGRSSDPFEIQAMCPEVDDLSGFRKLEEGGVTDAQVWPWSVYDTALDDLDGKIRAVERFSEEIIARMRQ